MFLHSDYRRNKGNAQGKNTLDDKSDVMRKINLILLFIKLFTMVERMHQGNSRQRQIIACYYQSSKLRHIKKDIVDVKRQKRLSDLISCIIQNIETSPDITLASL